MTYCYKYKAEQFSCQTKREGRMSSELLLFGAVYCMHRRRIEREAKAKVVASVWGADFVQFLATLAVLPRSIWKNIMNSTVS